VWTSLECGPSAPGGRTFRHHRWFIDMGCGHRRIFLFLHGNATYLRYFAKARSLRAEGSPLIARAHTGSAYLTFAESRLFPLGYGGLHASRSCYRLHSRGWVSEIRRASLSLDSQRDRYHPLPTLNIIHASLSGLLGLWPERIEGGRGGEEFWFLGKLPAATGQIRQVFPWKTSLPWSICRRGFVPGFCRPIVPACS